MVKGTVTGESRIEGGYRLISVAQLCWVWTAYRQKQIGFKELRVWFAAHEMSARRCQLTKGRVPRFTLTEMQLLVGNDVASLRAAIRKLQGAGCLSWCESSITFSAVPEDSAKESIEFQQMLGLIINNRRKVPVPRRILRLLACSSRPSTIATVLGFLLRCLYQKRGQSFPEGCCKASWVGEVFGLDPRNIRRAKQNLVALGWLLPKDSDHWHRQRWGGKAVINLDWSAPSTRRPAVKRSPYRLSDSVPQMPYPESDKKLLSESTNSKPAAPAPDGVSSKRGRGERGGKQTGLCCLKRDDLANPRQLQVLWMRACSARLVSQSSAERLNFFAAAQRALRVGTHNPPGLFVILVRRRLWSMISQGDEDQAREMLRTLERSAVLVPPIVRTLTPPKRPPSSQAISNPERQSAIRTQILHSLASGGTEDLPPFPADSSPIRFVTGGSVAQRRRVKVDRPAGGDPVGRDLEALPRSVQSQSRRMGNHSYSNHPSFGRDSHTVLRYGPSRRRKPVVVSATQTRV